MRRFVVGALGASLLAGPLAVTLDEQMQQNMLAICRMAAKSPSIDDTMTTQVVIACNQFRQLLDGAQKAAAAMKVKADAEAEAAKAAKPE